MHEIDHRRKHREKIGAADEVLVRVDDAMRKGGSVKGVPPMEATPELLAQDRLWEIRLNVAWVAAALQHARHEGWSECIAVWQPLIDWVNDTDDHRSALDEVVTDETLRTILYRALDTI